MNILEKLNAFLLEAPKEKENATVQKIVDELNRIFIKLEKQKATYAHGERSMSKDRYSVYDFLDKKRATDKLDTLINVLNKHGYKDPFTFRGGTERRLKKNADEYVEIQFDKRNTMQYVPEYIVFHYKRDAMYSFEK